MKTYNTYTTFDGLTPTFNNWKKCQENKNEMFSIADIVLNCSTLNTTDEQNIYSKKAAVIGAQNTFDLNTKWLTDSIINMNDFVCKKEIPGKPDLSDTEKI